MNALEENSNLAARAASLEDLVPILASAGASPADRLRALRSAVDGRIVFTTSFGIEDQAIAHWIFTSGLDIDVVTLDEPEFRPHVMARQFWHGWRHYGRPTLVTFNGRGLGPVGQFRDRDLAGRQPTVGALPLQCPGPILGVRLRLHAAQLRWTGRREPELSTGACAEVDQNGA